MTINVLPPTILRFCERGWRHSEIEDTRHALSRFASSSVVDERVASEMARTCHTEVHHEQAFLPPASVAHAARAVVTWNIGASIDACGEDSHCEARHSDRGLTSPIEPWACARKSNSSERTLLTSNREDRRS